MEDSLKKCLRKYEEAVFQLTGLVPKYDKLETPFIEEPTKQCVFRAPCDPLAENFVECPSCRHTFPETSVQDFTCPAGTQRKVGDFQREHVEREKALKDASATQDGTLGSGKNQTEKFGTSVDSGEETEYQSGSESDSEWTDEDDDGTNWWSGMHNRRPVRGTTGTSVVTAAVNSGGSPHQGFFNPNARGKKDYEGEHCLKDASAMMLMSILYPARLQDLTY